MASCGRRAGGRGCPGSWRRGARRRRRCRRRRGSREAGAPGGVEVGEERLVLLVGLERVAAAASSSTDVIGLTPWRGRVPRWARSRPPASARDARVCWSRGHLRSIHRPHLRGPVLLLPRRAATPDTYELPKPVKPAATRLTSTSRHPYATISLCMAGTPSHERLSMPRMVEAGGSRGPIFSINLTTSLVASPRSSTPPT